MRYLLSLILVIGFASVSYATTTNSQIRCGIKDLKEHVGGPIPKTLSLWNVKSKINMDDIIMFNYNEKSMHLDLYELDGTNIKPKSRDYSILQFDIETLISLQNTKVYVDNINPYLQIITYDAGGPKYPQIEWYITVDEIIVRTQDFKLRITKAFGIDWVGYYIYEPTFNNYELEKINKHRVIVAQLSCFETRANLSSLINNFNPN